MVNVVGWVMTEVPLECAKVVGDDDAQTVIGWSVTVM